MDVLRSLNYALWEFFSILSESQVGASGRFQIQYSSNRRRGVVGILDTVSRFALYD